MINSAASNHQYLFYCVLLSTVQKTTVASAQYFNVHREPSRPAQYLRREGIHVVQHELAFLEPLNISLDKNTQGQKRHDVVEIDILQ